MDIKNLIANFCTYQNETFAKLMHVNMREMNLRAGIKKLKHEKLRLQRTILQNKLRMQPAASYVLKRQKIRKVWTLVG